MLDKLKEIYNPFLTKEVVAPILIVVISVILYGIVHRLTKRFYQSKYNLMDIRKKKTMVSIINNICKYTLIILDFLLILNVFGISTTGLLASIGVVGVVAGLAIQDILKDILAGIFIIIENQYAVGDTVTIGTFQGEVISLGLRTTKIKSYTGEIMTIVNHNVSEVVNHSLAKSLAIVNVPVSYDENIEKVETVLTELCQELQGTLPNLAGDVKLLGITAFEESSINFRIVAECKAMEHYDIQRRMFRAIKIEFDKQKIEIPYNQLVVHNHEL